MTTQDLETLLWSLCSEAATRDLRRQAAAVERTREAIALALRDPSCELIDISELELLPASHPCLAPSPCDSCSFNRRSAEQS